MRLPLSLALLSGVLFFAPVALAEEPACFSLGTNPPPKVDMARVTQAWLTWNNRLRARLHLQPYVRNYYLTETAMNWSAYAVKRGTIDHKRYAGSPYYDYSAIEDWFSDKGLQFKNVTGRTFTENIGFGPYSCSSGDCTLKLIDAIHSTYNFYLSERSTNGSHYRSIANDAFREIGLGLAVSPNQNRYYLTVHYTTAITNTPPEMCNSK